MQLTPVESSHIAAYGYIEADRVLLVRYKDEGLYAFVGMSPERFADLEAAPSKGNWLGVNRYEFVNIRISKGGARGQSNAPGQTTTDQRVARESGPLNVIDEDADKCCREHLEGYLSLARRGAAPLFNAATCGHCGQQFQSEIIGPNLYWRIVPQVHIVRPR